MIQYKMWEMICKLQGTMQHAYSDNRSLLLKATTQILGKAFRGHPHHALGAGCLLQNKNSRPNPISSLGLKEKGKIKTGKKMSFSKSTGENFYS